MSIIYISHTSMFDKQLLIFESCTVGPVMGKHPSAQSLAVGNGVVAIYERFNIFQWQIELLPFCLLQSVILKSRCREPQFWYLFDLILHPKCPSFLFKICVTKSSVMTSL